MISHHRITGILFFVHSWWAVKPAATKRSSSCSISPVLYEYWISGVEFSLSKQEPRYGGERSQRYPDFFFFFCSLSLLPSEEVPLSFPWYKEMWVGSWNQKLQVTAVPMHFQPWPLQELVGLLASLSSVFWKHNHCSFLLLHTWRESKLPEYSASWYNSLSCFLDSVVSSSSFSLQVHL